jgi:caffeoyl-CoA O-methyltransferase
MIDISDALYHYCENHSKGLDPVLHELERATHLQTTQPRMLSGSLQGLFLQLISILHKPEKILEIGTFTGYSAMCLAKGLSENGRLITIDSNPETLILAREFISKSTFSDQIEIIEGNASDIIPGLADDFDLVFIDADKENYNHYYTMTRKKIKSGGLILLDNMLWSGKVLDTAKDARTKALDDLNTFIMHDEGVENVLLPLRDGIHVVRVK